MLGKHDCKALEFIPKMILNDILKGNKLQNNRQEIIHFIQQLLEDKKGENIEIFDLKDTD